jgi:sigma-B regulation protein RsbQ
MEVGAFMARHLAGSTLRVIEATGHCPHVSDPEVTIAAMRDYLGAAEHGRQLVPS